MSRIFAFAGVTTVLVAGAVAVGVTFEGLSNPSTDATSVAETFASGFDLGMAVPVVLIVGMLLAALVVMNR